METQLFSTFLLPTPFLEIGQGGEWGAFRILARSRSPMRRRNVIEIHSWFLLFPVHVGKEGGSFLILYLPLGNAEGLCTTQMRQPTHRLFYLQLFQ